MESLVESCLELAGKHNVSSVAFPALGTGKLGYPADIAAKTMFQCIHRYLTQNKTTSIRQINIVIYPKDIRTLKVSLCGQNVKAIRLMKWRMENGFSHPSYNSFTYCTRRNAHGEEIFVIFTMTIIPGIYIYS